MAIVTKPNTFTANTPAVAAEVNANFDAIFNDHNGNIENGNISNSAGILASKLNLSAPGSIGSGTPSTGKFTTLEATTSLKLAVGATVTELSIDGTLAGDSDTAVPTEKAVKTYADSKGKVLQAVNYQTGAKIESLLTIPADDSIPQIGEGSECMTLAITPKKATSHLKIDVVAHIGPQTAPEQVIAALFNTDVDASNALAAGIGNSNPNSSQPVNVKFTHWMDSPGTSATTFRVRCGADAGANNGTFNGRAAIRYLGGALASSITITEIDS